MKMLLRIFILTSVSLFPALSFGGIESIQWGPEFEVSFPQPLQVGVQLACTGDTFLCHPSWKYYVDGGAFGVPLSSGSRNLNIFSVETGARFIPFSFPLTFALGIGYRYISFSTQDVSAFLLDGEAVASEASLNFATLYLGPSIGWDFALSDQLSLGIQAGVQLALIGNGSLFLSDKSTGANSANSALLATDSGAPLGRVASLVVPSLTLVRLTWRFD